jgi:methylthioribose-1-phosphate isomerase
MIRAVAWTDNGVEFLDQTLLPHREVTIATRDRTVLQDAIRSLKIRGAPAIGIAAAYGVCLAAGEATDAPPAALVAHIERAMADLAATRPTAVNLFSALDRMRAVLQLRRSDGPEAIREALLREALALHEEDARACAAIGEAGAGLLPPHAVILTHCNAGAIATGGIGTALGIITTAAAGAGVRRVYVDETRPLLQGSRLTAWELRKAGIEAVLITDSTAASVLRTGGVHAVIVGADRIAANGDTANKVGTYPLAVMAHRHGVPFYVAAPRTTLDPRTPAGEQIPIEERSADEVTHVHGVRMAPPGILVFSPAFDVTPHDLISAIITDAGVLRPPYGPAIARACGRADR